MADDDEIDFGEIINFIIYVCIVILKILVYKIYTKLKKENGKLNNIIK